MISKRIASLLLVFIATVATVGSWRHPPKSNTIGDAFRFDARKLADTSAWTKVNAEPYRISSELDFLCARPPTPDDASKFYAQERKKNPHAGTFITVYVNQVARAAMFTKDSPIFPAGSVIVKQKSDRLPARNTVLYTVMRKRENGYNPTVGDWEFSVVNADGTTVEASGKLENCQGCHVKQPSTDFVFRSYVDFK